ncbi:MAG TPA: RNA polymerase sigma factor [Planctomycetes bacterium]|nr:RNA polymerase sigma factor [Planctomycetota bacterium]
MEEISHELVRNAQDGDEEAIRSLIEALHRPIHSTIHRFLGTRFANQAEDIAQDIFLKIFRTLHRFDPDRGVKFTTWVFAYVRNHCFDVLKKRRISTVSLHPGRVGEEDDKWELQDPSARKPSENALNSELGVQIEHALQRLNDAQRMVFVLREYEQLDLKTIAKIMDSTEGTVKSRLHRARESLKQLLAPYLESRPDLIGDGQRGDQREQG